MPDVQPQQSQQVSQQASNPGDAAYQRWLAQHPNAGAVEKDVMRKALGGQTQQAAPQAQQQVQPLKPLSNGQMPPAPEPAVRQQAIGRALANPVS